MQKTMFEMRYFRIKRQNWFTWLHRDRCVRLCLGLLEVTTLAVQQYHYCLFLK